MIKLAIVLMHAVCSPVDNVHSPVIKNEVGVNYRKLHRAHKKAQRKYNKHTHCRGAM